MIGWDHAISADPKEMRQLVSSTKSCKTIFFDWAIDLEIEADQKRAISQLLDEYGSKYPSHPMTILLLSGLKTLDQKDKRKRKRKKSS